MKKATIILAILIFVLVGCNSVKSFDDGLKDRMKVVKMIESGELRQSDYELKNTPQLLELPDKYKNLSDGGEIVICSYEGKVAIYFYEYRGNLESSKGYLYFSKKLSPDDYKEFGNSFVNLKDLGNGWFSCSTDD